jgi:hypothetical protein
MDAPSRGLEKCRPTISRTVRLSVAALQTRLGEGYDLAKNLGSRPISGFVDIVEAEGASPYQTLKLTDRRGRGIHEAKRHTLIYKENRSKNSG